MQLETVSTPTPGAARPTAVASQGPRFVERSSEEETCATGLSGSPSCSPFSWSSRPVADPAPTSRRSASSPTSGTLEDKSFNEASWVGAQAGAKAIGGTASNIVTKAPADYAANIKTFVDQGYGIIVTVGFAMGDATTIAAKQYPKVKFIGVDQGVCIDETGKGDPTFACKGDPKTLLPNYQGLVFKEAGRLPRRRPRGGASRSRASSAPSAASTRSRRSSRYINGYRNGAASVNDKIDVKVAYVSTDITKALQRPGHRQVDRPADDRAQKPT